MPCFNHFGSFQILPFPLNFIHGGLTWVQYFKSFFLTGNEYFSGSYGISCDRCCWNQLRQRIYHTQCGVCVEMEGHQLFTVFPLPLQYLHNIFYIYFPHLIFFKYSSNIYRTSSWKLSQAWEMLLLWEIFRGFGPQTFTYTDSRVLKWGNDVKPFGPYTFTNNISRALNEAKMFKDFDL